MGIAHAFQSGKADGADATLVRPSSWNADHVFTGVPRTAAADLAIASNASMVVSDSYEVASGVAFELASDGILEVL